MSVVNSDIIINRQNPPFFKKTEAAEAVFRIFEHCAANSTSEIWGRNFWVENSPEEKRRIYAIGLSDYVNSKCGITYNAIMSVLFGKEFESSTKVNTFISEQRQEIKSFKVLIEKNSHLLLFGDHTEFFAYGFKLYDTGIYGLHSFNTYGGHAFVIIQFLNADNQIQYSLLQSYVINYTLQDYIDSKKGIFNELEFLEFLNAIEDLISATKWSLKIQDSYQNFFGVNHNYEENATFSYPIMLEIKWGEGSYSEASKHRDDFETFRASEDFPKLFNLISDQEEKFLEISRLLESKSKGKSLNVVCDFFHPYKSKTIEIRSSKAQFLEALLSISSSKIEDLDSFFKNYPLLEEFDGSLCEAEIKVSHFPSSLKIVLLKNTNIDDQSLDNLYLSCPQLEELDISFCKNITKLPEHLPSSLRIVRLASTQIKDEDIEQLFTQCPGLEEVDIINCRNVTKLPIKLPASLVKIKLNKTRISANDLERLLKQCGNIKKIYASRCANIDSIPEELPPYLKFFTLNETIADSAIVELEKKYPEICFSD